MTQLNFNNLDALIGRNEAIIVTGVNLEAPAQSLEFMKRWEAGLENPITFRSNFNNVPVIIAEMRRLGSGPAFNYENNGCLWLKKHNPLWQVYTTETHRPATFVTITWENFKELLLGVPRLKRRL